MPYATLDQVKLFLGITDASRDQLLTYLLERASKLIDDFCQRTFETKSEERSFIVREDQTPKLFIPDLISITSLEIEEVSILSDAYKLFPTDAPSQEEPYRWIELFNGQFKKGEEVKINGNWGYWTTVPDEINFACVLWTIRLFRKKDQPEGRIASESIGDYSVSYEKTEKGKTERPEDILNSFKRKDLESF